MRSCLYLSKIHTFFPDNWKKLRLSSPLFKNFPFCVLSCQHTITMYLWEKLHFFYESGKIPVFLQCFEKNIILWWSFHNFRVFFKGKFKYFLVLYDGFFLHFSLILTKIEFLTELFIFCSLSKLAFFLSILWLNSHCFHCNLKKFAFCRRPFSIDIFCSWHLLSYAHFLRDCLATFLFYFLFLMKLTLFHSIFGEIRVFASFFHLIHIYFDALTKMSIVSAAVWQNSCLFTAISWNLQFFAVLNYFFRDSLTNFFAIFRLNSYFLRSSQKIGVFGSSHWQIFHFSVIVSLISRSFVKNRTFSAAL